MTILNEKIKIGQFLSEFIVTNFISSATFALLLHLESSKQSNHTRGVEKFAIYPTSQYLNKSFFFCKFFLTLQI